MSPPSKANDGGTYSTASKDGELMCFALVIGFLRSTVTIQGKWQAERTSKGHRLPERIAIDDEHAADAAQRHAMTHAGDRSFFPLKVPIMRADREHGRSCCQGR